MIVSSLLALSRFYIITIGQMASKQAKSDLGLFPKVVIASKDTLPTEIMSPDLPDLSKPLRIVVINNNRIYVYLDGDQDKLRADQSPNLYAIDSASVQYLQLSGR